MAIPNVTVEGNSVIALAWSNASNDFSPVSVDASGNILVSSASQTSSAATSTMGSGSVTTAATFQQVLPANSARRGGLIQNTSTVVMYLYLGATASATEAGSFQIAAGASFSLNQGDLVLTDAVQVTSGTAASTFVYAVQ